MKRRALFAGTIALAAMLGTIPVQAQKVEVDLFSPDVTWPICIDFDNFADGIELQSILADKMVVAIWRNHDNAGSDAPMLGGFTKGPPRRSYVMSDIDDPTPGAMFVFTLEVDLGTFDLWNQDTVGNLTQFQDNEPYTAYSGPCPFRPDEVFPTSAAR